MTDSANDDSQLFAPAPVEPPVVQTPKVLKAAVRKVTSKLKGTTLIFTIRNIRKVRVSILGKRHGKIVAQAKSGLLRPGTHKVRMKLNTRHWPTKISMKVTEPSAKSAALRSCVVGAGSKCA